MSTVNTLIKWPGGKTRDIKYIEDLIPEFDRYIEPFFGGGAMFFYLRPAKAVINDISSDLMNFYSLVKAQDKMFGNYLDLYGNLFNKIIRFCENFYGAVLSIYEAVKNTGDKTEIEKSLDVFTDKMLYEIGSDISEKLIINTDAFKDKLICNALDKMQRTVKNETKSVFSNEDLKENLITGFLSGTYMYFRDVYNDIVLKRNTTVSKEYRAAVFYFIREYCYGSMFRYNSSGEFNIPYGGMSYNRKDFKAKTEEIFCTNTEKLFSNTDIHCRDFEDFFKEVELTENDFMFLDPPYDTDFSDYEGRDFTHKDQKRLCESLKNTKSKFILIIKNTDFIYSLYKDNFNILCFDKTYTYNVRSRNERNAEHLIITNINI